MLAYTDVAKGFGLQVSPGKTKLMGVGRLAPVSVGISEIECVEELHVGSVITSSGRMDAKTDRRINIAFRAFGALCKGVHKDRNLHINTKQMVYQTCALCCMALNAGHHYADTSDSLMHFTISCISSLE